MSSSIKTNNMGLEDYQPTLFLFGVNLSDKSRSFHFITLTLLTFAFYILFGYIQELMFHVPHFRNHSIFLSLTLLFIYTILSFVELKVAKRSPLSRKAPLTQYFFLGFFVAVTVVCTNLAMAYLNYPTIVMFKCCKLIPVLLFGMIVQGKKYNIYDILATLSMCIGLIFFILADIKIQADFDTIGVVFVCIALCADAFVGNVQEKIMKTFQADNLEVILFTYSIGFCYILLQQTFVGQFAEAFIFWMQNPVKTFLCSFILSIAGYLGLNVVLHLINHFGILIATTVTTCRKALTIFLSFIIFSKPFTYQYLWSGFLVIIGIYLNLFSKNRERWERVCIDYLQCIVRRSRLNFDPHMKKSRSAVELDNGTV